MLIILTLGRAQPIDRPLAACYNKSITRDEGLSPGKRYKMKQTEEQRAAKAAEYMERKGENLDKLLIQAASDGHTDTVKLLLDAGANVHAENDQALRWAASDGHTDTVKLLLDAGANVHACDDDALRLAAFDSYTDTVKLLLDAGANAHANYDEALRLAASTEIVKLLKNY